MARSQYGPAAGTPQGAAPRPATFFVPDFARLDGALLDFLLHKCRDAIVVHLYMLLHTGCEFKSGHMLTTYARLIELMTPPAPERGRRRPGPTYKQLRTAMDTLEAFHLIRRDLGGNQAQGQLRLYVTCFGLGQTKKENVRPLRKRAGFRAGCRGPRSRVNAGFAGFFHGIQGSIRGRGDTEELPFSTTARERRVAHIAIHRLINTGPASGAEQAPGWRHAMEL